MSVPVSVPRRVTILGATGSIGRSTRDVILANPGRFEVAAVVGGRNAAALAEAATALGARFAAVSDPTLGGALASALEGTGIACGAGGGAVRDAAAMEADIVVAGIAGVAGLEPTVAALGAGRRIALANKETLVCAGNFFMAEAARQGASVVPMDSEHNAVRQALAGRPMAHVARIVLTASGGPFRTWNKERIASATRAEALAHPNYAMGSKVTIDSASLMNKGLELIEAHHIFGAPAEMLSAVVHPQQIVHGMVYFTDGSVVAGMALPDMRVPIADCLAEDGRLNSRVGLPDLAAIGALNFEAPDTDRFPCLALAMEALAEGGSAPAILNAANEAAVAAFLDGAIKFADIHAIVATTLEKLIQRAPEAPRSVEEALFIDHIARNAAREIARGRGIRQG